LYGLLGWQRRRRKRERKRRVEGNRGGAREGRSAAAGWKGRQSW
jgi:hypothetical protein